MEQQQYGPHGPKATGRKSKPQAAREHNMAAGEANKFSTNTLHSKFFISMDMTNIYVTGNFYLKKKRENVIAPRE